MAKLLINRGSFRVSEIDLKRGTLTVGRDADNNIPVPDTAVSGHHAKIVTLFDACYIQDLDSTNGTFVNGKRVQEHTLRNGDVITLGNHQILFESDAQLATDNPTSNHTMVMNRQELDRLIAAREGTFAAERSRPAPSAARVATAPKPPAGAAAPPVSDSPPPRSRPSPAPASSPANTARPRTRSASTPTRTPAAPTTDHTAHGTNEELPAGPSSWPLWLVVTAAVIVAGALVTVAVLFD